jgi:hypothetical protein
MRRAACACNDYFNAALMRRLCKLEQQVRRAMRRNDFDFVG